MVWPFANTECWQIGPTHGRNARGQNMKSALDLAPDLYHGKYPPSRNFLYICLRDVPLLKYPLRFVLIILPFILGWGQPFHHLQSNGSVHAMMSGEVQMISPCSLNISTNHNGIHFQVYYTHIRIDSGITDGQTVAQGQRIGQIETNKMNANCNGDYNAILNGEPTEVATGPHLHIELFRNQQHESLHDKEVSGYIIKAGKYYLDQDLADHCLNADDCANAVVKHTNNNEHCATRFVDKANASNVFCPSVVGANHGNLQMKC